MPRKREYTLVTILRTGDDVHSVDFAEGLSHEQLEVRLQTPPGGGMEAERRVFSGVEVPWSPSVRIGRTAKRKAATTDTKKTRKPREEKPNGTRFEPDGAKSANQGDAHGA